LLMNNPNGSTNITLKEFIFGFIPRPTVLNFLDIILFFPAY